MDLYEFWDDFTWATEGSQQVEVGDVAAARGATCSVHRYPHKVQMLSETKVNVIIHNSEFWKKKIFEFLFPAHWLSDWTEVVTWRKKLEKLFPPFDFWKTARLIDVLLFFLFFISQQCGGRIETLGTYLDIYRCQLWQVCVYWPRFDQKVTCTFLRLDCTCNLWPGVVLEPPAQDVQ